jgi:hypothetical protein
LRDLQFQLELDQFLERLFPRDVFTAAAMQLLPLRNVEDRDRFAVYDGRDLRADRRRMERRKRKCERGKAE